MEEVLVPLIIIPVMFVVLPWLILHYVTKWKANAGLTAEDENLLDDLYELARRLDERMNTVERIMQADNPGWQPGTADAGPPPPRLEKHHDFDDPLATARRRQTQGRA